jgi:hypothetical protein
VHQTLDAEVAVLLENQGDLDGVLTTVVSIEIWRVDADGGVCSVRSFFEPDPGVHDPWYLLGGQGGVSPA